MNTGKRLLTSKLLLKLSYLLFALYPLTMNNDSMFYGCVTAFTALMIAIVIIARWPPKLDFKQLMCDNNWCLICADFIISLTGIILCMKYGLPRLVIIWGVLIVTGCIEAIEKLRKRNGTRH
jgi:hypothetical protein